MKHFIILALFVMSFFDNLSGQVEPVYKESIENFYARKFAEKSFKLIRCEVLKQEKSNQYVSDSLQYEAIHSILREAYNHTKKNDVSELQKNAFKSIVFMAFDTYFSAKDKYHKHDMTKIILVKGNITYSIIENGTKTSLYEDFITTFTLDNKVIFNFEVK
jgi:hypothetical protein